MQSAPTALHARTPRRRRSLCRSNVASLPHLCQPLEPRMLLAYAPIGPEVIVSEGQDYPRAVAAMNDAGDFVVADIRGQTIHVRPYDADGGARGDGSELSLPSTKFQYFNPSPAIDNDGNFLVVVNVDDSLYAQRYDAAANPVGELFRVNDVPSNPPGQLYADVAMTPDGRFVIAWSGAGADGHANDIFARRYDAAGVAQGEPFKLNEQVSDQGYPHVGIDDAGNFTVGWRRYGHDSIPDPLIVRRFDATGNPLTGEILVNGPRPATYLGGMGV